jgi:hypothetical protein
MDDLLSGPDARAETGLDVERAAHPACTQVRLLGGEAMRVPTAGSQSGRQDVEKRDEP